MQEIWRVRNTLVILLYQLTYKGKRIQFLDNYKYRIFLIFIEDGTMEIEFHIIPRRKYSFIVSVCGFDD